MSDDITNELKDCRPSTEQEGGLTVIIQRTARRGKEREMEEWIAGISNAAVGFPGHLGQHIIRPVDPANPEYVIIFRFDTYEHLMAWHTSDVRRSWVEKVRPLSTGKPKIRTVQGMSAWFSMPAAPPRWKTALIIFLALCPLVIGIGACVSMLFGGLHQYIRQIIAVAITVIVMTWGVMPHLNKLLKSWLYRGREVRLPGARPLH